MHGSPLLGLSRTLASSSRIKGWQENGGKKIVFIFMPHLLAKGSSNRGRSPTIGNTEGGNLA